jgi:NADH-quinone oxidoreductase subunit G
VLCARCTRFSQQIAGDPFIELFERGALEQVAVYEDEPFESYFSGNTVQICPVGALTGAQYRFRARPFDLRSTPSVCEHCASGCAQRTDWRRGKVMRRLAGDDPQVNEEWNCDKGRWAFAYASANDRITAPLVRDEEGYLVETSWTEALMRAAEGLRPAIGRTGVLPGGRLTFEDAYAYAKFARTVLRTDDVDFRSRPHSREESEFLAARVAGRTDTTYADISRAPVVLLVGFEPEEESPIVFLRLRKAMRDGLRVASVAPMTSNGLRKAGGTLLRTAPGDEPAVLSALADGNSESAEISGLLRQNGAVILVGERLATVPGGLSAVARLAETTGAQLAWVPRRAGDRGALDAGLLPGLLPGGRALAAAAEIGWTGAPSQPGRDLAGIVEAARTGGLGALVVGAVDPADLPDPQAAIDALETVPFLVSLEIRESEVTARADVVLPVAPAVEKSGSYLNWEGRVRPFPETLVATGSLPDGRVLHVLAEELGIDLGLPDVAAARVELERVGRAHGGRGSGPSYAAGTPAQPERGQALLATWSLLLDAGRLQDGEPHLAGTAKKATAVLNAATAEEIGVSVGQPVTVSTDRGSITLPVSIIDLPDRVVWLPTNSVGSAVRRDLVANAGDVVRLSASGGGR